MACTENPSPDSGCLSILSANNTQDAGALWSTTANRVPSDWGCETFIYVGQYISQYETTFFGGNTCGTEDNPPADWEEDTYTIQNFSSTAFSGSCTDNPSDNIIVYCERWIEDIDATWFWTTTTTQCPPESTGTWIKQRTRYVHEEYYIVTTSSEDDFCPPGTRRNPLTGLCEACADSSFEILKNTTFTTITDSTTATEWTSEGVVFNQTSLSDFTTSDNIAHFGDAACEYIRQPITLDLGEYRYNATMPYGVEISYIDIRNAAADATITINIGGELDVYDLDRIRDELPLGNTGIDGVYSFQTGDEIERIESPVPSVSPGTYAIAELWQMGNIILEVTKFGILGYIPCVEGDLYEIQATEEIIECTPPPPCMPQYLYNQDLYRRQIVTFKTDIQGLIPQYLDKIMISHSALQWGEAGAVASRDTDTLTLSENLVDITNGKTIVFRDINGDISGAYGMSIIDEYTIEVLGMPDWVTVNTFYTIQEMATAKEFLVISVRPSGDDVTIECVNYDENIYKDGGC